MVFLFFRFRCCWMVLASTLIPGTASIYVLLHRPQRKDRVSPLRAKYVLTVQLHGPFGCELSRRIGDLTIFGCTVGASDITQSRVSSSTLVSDTSNRSLDDVGSLKWGLQQGCL